MKISSGKSKRKELEPSKIKEIMNSLAYFAPKNKFPNGDAKVIAKALLDDTGLRNSIAQVPWISNGECELLHKSGFETLAVNKGLVTTEAYKNLLKDIVAISSGGKDSANNDQPGVDKHFVEAEIWSPIRSSEAGAHEWRQR